MLVAVMNILQDQTWEDFCVPLCTFQDHVLPQNQNLKSLSIREFASMVFDVCPGLDQYKVSSYCQGWAPSCSMQLIA